MGVLEEGVNEEGVGEEPGSDIAPRVGERFQRSTRKLSSSGQTSSSFEGLTDELSAPGGGNTG